MPHAVKGYRISLSGFEFPQESIPRRVNSYVKSTDKAVESLQSLRFLLLSEIGEQIQIELADSQLVVVISAKFKSTYMPDGQKQLDSPLG